MEDRDDERTLPEGAKLTPALSDQLAAEMREIIRQGNAQGATPEEAERLAEARKAIEQDDVDFADDGLEGARLRAHRSNMLKRLMKRYGNYEPFTPADAAERCKVRESDLEGYLRYEARLRGSRIQRAGPAAYMIVSPFGP